MPVDTHVFRVSRRLGLSNKKDVLEVERDLLNKIDKNELIDAHHLILLFGRYFCKAQHPLCDDCVLKRYCKRGLNDDIR